MTTTSTTTDAPTIGGLPLTQVYVAVPIRAEDLRVGDMVRWEWDAAAAAAQEAAAPEGTTLTVCREPYDVGPIYDLRVRSFAHDGPAVVAVPMNPRFPTRFEVEHLADFVPVYVWPSYITTPRGHGQRISSHAPKKRGWYTDPGGWDVACSCGWQAPEVVAGNHDHAAGVWARHKAETLNELLSFPKHYPGKAQAFAVRSRPRPWQEWRWRLEYGQ